MLKEILLPHEDHVGQQCRKKAPMLFKGMLLELLHNVPLNCFKVCTCQNSYSLCGTAMQPMLDLHTKISPVLVTLYGVLTETHFAKTTACELQEASWRRGQLNSRETWNISPHCEASAAPGGERTRRKVNLIMTQCLGCFSDFGPTCPGEIYSKVQLANAEKT